MFLHIWRKHKENNFSLFGFIFDSQKGATEYFEIEWRVKADDTKVEIATVAVAISVLVMTAVALAKKELVVRSKKEEEVVACRYGGNDIGRGLVWCFNKVGRLS